MPFLLLKHICTLNIRLFNFACICALYAWDNFYTTFFKESFMLMHEAVVHSLPLLHIISLTRFWIFTLLCSYKQCCQHMQASLVWLGWCTRSGFAQIITRGWLALPHRLLYSFTLTPNCFSSWLYQFIFPWEMYRNFSCSISLLQSYCPTI